MFSSSQVRGKLQKAIAEDAERAKKWQSDRDEDYQKVEAAAWEANQVIRPLCFVFGRDNCTTVYYNRVGSAA